MSELGEIYRDLYAERRARKEANTRNSIALLKEMKVRFQVLEPLIPHLFVAGLYDFWPSTGLYIERGGIRRGRGVFNLLRDIRAKKEQES